jgi:hypothetical protein
LAQLAEARTAIDCAVELMATARMRCSDAGLFRRELTLAARMLRHATRRGQLARGPALVSAAELRSELGKIVADYRDIWLARDRAGGLDDSVGRLERALGESQVG